MTNKKFYQGIQRRHNRIPKTQCRPNNILLHQLPIYIFRKYRKGVLLQYLDIASLGKEKGTARVSLARIDATTRNIASTDHGIGDSASVGSIASCVIDERDLNTTKKIGNGATRLMMSDTRH